MENSKKKELFEAYKDVAANYWNTFVYFKEASGDVVLASRLTRDMFSAVFGRNGSNEKKTEIPPGFFDMKKGGPLS